MDERFEKEDEAGTERGRRSAVRVILPEQRPSTSRTVAQ
jgi:hypothetical protein